MLDTLKNMTGGKGRGVQDQVGQLEAVILAAREERTAVNNMLTNLIARSVRMAPLAKSMEDIEATAAALAKKLETVTERVATLEDRTQQVGRLDERLLVLTHKTHAAEQAIDALIGPNSEFTTERGTFQQLLTEAKMTSVVLKKLDSERPALEALRTQLQTTATDVKASTSEAIAIKSDLDQVRVLAATLKKDYGVIRQTAQDARESSQAALGAAEAAEAKAAPLVSLQQAMTNVDEKLAALNALSEHVIRKVKSIEGQQQAVEHAVLQANRVNELAWEMENKTTKLTEGIRQAADVEDTLTRIEQLMGDASVKLADANRLKSDLQNQTTKLNEEQTGMLSAVRSELTKIEGRKKEFETFEVRMRTLQTLVGTAEGRMSVLTEKDKELTGLAQKVDTLSQCFEALYSQADDLTKQQLSLEPLRDQLAAVNGLASKTTWQMDALRKSQAELESVRTEIQQFYGSHAEVAKLVDKLSADRRSLEGLHDRLTSFQSQTPKLEGKVDAILGKMTRIDEGTEKAVLLADSLKQLESQLAHVNGRVLFVEKLEERLNGLNVLSASVDRRLDEQLAQQNELDAMRAACNGLTEQVHDAQHKLEAIRRLGGSLAPIAAEVTKVQNEITAVEKRLTSVKFTEAAVGDMEKRYTDLVTASREVSDQVTERSRQVRALNDEVARAATIKDEMLAELERTQQRQRDTVAHIRASEDLLKRAESMFKQFEQSASQLAFGEKKLGVVEGRLAEVRQLADDAQKSVAALASREQIILAVKAEVENIHAIGERSREDLTKVVEHSDEVNVLKAKVDLLLSKIAETNEHMDTIDVRRKKVDEVEAKVNGITHLLDDVRINLETLGEQKVVVDHVAEQLETTLLEARNTVRSLQQERELAQRIERGIRQLRNRAA